MPELTTHEQENEDFIKWLDSHPDPMAMLLKGLELIKELTDCMEGAGDQPWGGKRFTPERIADYRAQCDGVKVVAAEDVMDILDEVEYCHYNMDGLAIGLKIAALGKEIDRQRIEKLESANSSDDRVFSKLFSDLVGMAPLDDDDETPCDCSNCCKEDDDS